MFAGGTTTAHSLSPARACRSCAHFKTKCIPHGSNIPKCERCHRLNKICEAQIHVPRKPRRRNLTRTAQLEEKLDGIVSLLTGGQHLAAPQDGPTGFPKPNKSSEEHSPNTNVEFSLTSPLPWSGQGVVAPVAQLATSKTTRVQPTVLLGQDDATPDHLLDMFRSQMSPNFPFVVVSHRMSAEELQQERPFLYLAIMVAASCKHVAMQTRLRNDFMAQLYEKTLIQNKKNLDIFQGLLVFIAWYHYHLPTPQLTNLTHLAIAMSLDLGLNRPLKGVERHEMLMEATKCRSLRLDIRERHLDERRAFLGLYWLTSVLSAYTGVDPIRDTPYVQECFHALVRSNEHISDAHVVYLARLQNIAEKLRSVSVPMDGIDQPLVKYIQLLHAELRQIKEHLTGQPEQNQVFESHYCSAEISLFEVGIYKPTLPLKISENFLRQMRLLQWCLESIKSFFHVYLSLPSTSYFTFTIGFFTGLSHVFITLSKLTLFEHEFWDASQIKQDLDLSEMLSQLVERFEEAGKQFEVDLVTAQHNDSFSRLAKKICRIRDWFDGRHVVGGSPEVVPPENREALGFDGEGMAGMQIGVLDEPFWLELMCGWEAFE